MLECPIESIVMGGSSDKHPVETTSSTKRPYFIPAAST